MTEEGGAAAALESYDREKTVLLTRSQEERLEELVLALRHATDGLKINFSDLTRGFLTVAFDIEVDLLSIARTAMKRVPGHPATADGAGKRALEKQLASVIRDAVCSASRRRPG